MNRTRPVDVPVQNLDVLPTLLDYLGFDLARLSDELGLEGHSLRGAIEADRAPGPHTFSIQGAETAVSDDRFTLTLDLETRRVALFDRREDPDHTRNVAPGKPGKTAELREAADAWLERHDGPAGVAADAQQLEEELRALGYIQDPPAKASGSPASRPR